MKAELARLLGPDAVAEVRGPALLRVRPSNTQQVADVLGLCSRQGWAARAAGAGTRRRPDEGTGPRLVLSTERLVGLTTYEPEDLTLGTRAGTVHQALDAVTAAHAQLLPLVPAAGGTATIGGTVALADAGPLRAGYGTPRDLVLGITVVTGDGRALTFGGRVVKNVAGYDVVRLLVGSRGTLGVITELHLRLRSRPEHDRTILMEAADADAAASLALAVRDAAAPAALEITAPRVRKPWQVAARLHGSELAVREATARVLALGAAGRELEAAAAEAWWDGLAAHERAAPLRLRLTALPDRCGALLAAAHRFLNAWSDNQMKDRPGDVCVAHATEGIVRVGCELPAARAHERPREALDALSAEVASIGGTWRYEMKGRSVPEGWPTPPPRADAVRRIEQGLKASFDPAAVLPALQ